ncbi:MAG TPA: hypothetical protein VHE14_03630 [Solirubrobacteraceae bacterium]|nr:hypothetical protein [Solirubrobacteraceae bacterium]
MRTLPGRAIFLAVLFSLAALPCSALAKSRHGHARAKSHHRKGHKKQVRLQRFGSPPGASNPQNAGTVVSFANGVLTIRLTGADTVSGRVGNDTQVDCQTAQSAPPAQADDRVVGQQGDQGNQPAPQGTPPTNPGSGQHGDNQGDNANNDDGDANDADDQGDDAQSCDSTALTPGTVVREAELSIGSQGSTFKTVELVQ